MIGTDFLRTIDDFFDSLKPCPDNINNCEQLRKDFLDKVESLKQNGGCSSCRMRNLRANYYQVVKANLKNS
jgi:hypothetical protein